MKRVALCIVISSCLAAVTSCEQSNVNQAGLDTPSLGVTDAGPAVGQPRFEGRILCHDVKNGPNVGANGSFGPDGMLTWGYPGAVSEITWQFVTHRDGNDVYEFHRRFPADGDTPETQSKQVAFGGNSVIIFEDGFHKISIMPTASEPAAAPDLAR